MAEGMLRAWGGQRFEAFSAGSWATSVRPSAIAVMAELGIDISNQRSKAVNELSGQQFDYAVTVCDESREACPYFPGARVQLHWRFDDPSAGGIDLFRRVRDEIADQIRAFIADVESTEQATDGDPITIS
jgi:arsenate reductase